jgi:hypothetical protein
LITLASYEKDSRILKLALAISSSFQGFDLPKSEIADRILYGCSALFQARYKGGEENSIRTPFTRFKPFVGSKVHFTHGNLDESNFKFVAAIDPISTTGQKVLAVLSQFKEVAGVSVQVFTMGTSMSSEDDKLPLLRYYRSIFRTTPRFNEKGESISKPIAFKRLPKNVLMTLGIDGTLSSI